MSFIGQKHIYFVFVFSGLFCSAQIDSRGGRFSVEFDKGCTPFTISLTEASEIRSITKSYSFGDGFLETIDTFYTYNEPGKYRIVQLLALDIVPKTDTLFIEVIDPQPLSLSFFPCDDETLRAVGSFDFYDEYAIMLANNDSLLVNKDDSAVTLNLQENNVFKILGKKNGFSVPCVEETVDLSNYLKPPLPSFPSINYTYRCDLNVDFSFSFENPSEYLVAIELQEGENQTGLFLGRPESNFIKFSEIQVSGKSDSICLQVNYLNACTLTPILSESYCYATNSIIQRQISAYATYDDENNILIYFNSDTSENIRIDRLFDGERISTHLTKNSPYIFSKPLPTRQFSFNLIVTDTCIRKDEIFEISPPHLLYHKIFTNTYSLQIKMPVLSSDNLLNKSFWINNIPLNVAESGTTVELSDSLDETTTFSWLGITTNLDSIWSNSVTLSYDYRVHVPTAFSPNSDGINDRLELFSLPENFEFKIYNSSGRVVFENSDATIFWDGRQLGKVLPGIYFYKIIFITRYGKTITQEGSFVLIL